MKEEDGRSRSKKVREEIINLNESSVTAEIPGRMRREIYIPTQS